MATQKVIIKVKHKPDCFAVKAVLRGDWDSPWFFDGDVFRADKQGGRRSRWHRWQPFICNDPHCPAHGIVLVEWLERLVYLGSRMAAEAAKAEHQ